VCAVVITAVIKTILIAVEMSSVTNSTTIIIPIINVEVSVIASTVATMSSITMETFAVAISSTIVIVERGAVGWVGGGDVSPRHAMQHLVATSTPLAPDQEENNNSDDDKCQHRYDDDQNHVNSTHVAHTRTRVPGVPD